MPMRPEIIKKPWGMEWCAFDNGDAAIWVLHIAKGRKTSLHCHPNKRTTLILLSGSAECKAAYDPKGFALPSLKIKTLAPLVIAKGVYHQTECPVDSDISPTSENGAWLLEIEEPSNKADIIRAGDDYGRAGQPIESGGIEHKGPILQLYDGPQQFMGYTLRISPDMGIGTGEDINFTLGEAKNHWLSITKNKTMKLSDYVANFIADLGIRHVFSVAGGGSMHLVDSFGKHERIKYVATHHEQAAAMAADSYSRMGGLGCCLVTTGPGGSNAITGVCCSWVDSIPVIYISGQVTTDTLIGETGLRQFGVQETDIVRLVTPITKMAVTVRDAKNIRQILEVAVHVTTSGKPGPVWLDIPLDVQAQHINPDHLIGFAGFQHEYVAHAKPQEIEDALSALREAKRPVLIVGNGVRLAGAEAELLVLIKTLGIPVVSSWLASDMLGDDAHHIGHCGIFGDRASNFTVQNADLLLVIGCRLSVPQIGYNFKTFAREAKIIMVDVDKNEIRKPSLNVHMGIVSDAKSFIVSLSERLGKFEWGRLPWLLTTWGLKKKYPVCLPEYAAQTNGVNSFYFIDVLSKALPSDAVVVLDMATAFTCTYQTAKMEHGQRWITAAGHAPMGYGLPGAIGAHFATGKKIVCIVGDGALQMNVQELQTIAHHKLPITIFVLNNGGYLSIKLMQSNHFDRRVGSDQESGLSCPDTGLIAYAYGIDIYKISDHQDLAGHPDFAACLRGILSHDTPQICEIMMDKSQALIPRVASKKMPDGSIRSTAIEDMFPFLPRDEFNAAMIVKPVDALE